MEYKEILIVSEGVFHCGPCHIRCLDESEYREHLDSHDFDCLYRCLYCIALSPCTSSLTEHIGLVHPNKDKYYGCLVFPTTEQIMQVLHSRKGTPKSSPIANVKKSSEMASAKENGKPSSKLQSTSDINSETARSDIKPENTKHSSEQSSDVSDKTTTNANDKRADEIRKEHSNLPASPIQLSDDDSDIEVTGESKSPSRSPKTIAKDEDRDSFQTSLQCVYNKGRYVCKSCSQASGNYIQFAQHLYKHLHGSEDHNCPYCPAGTYTIQRPLSCSLVTQLMGILQKQKKVQEMSRQPPPLQGPFTNTDNKKVSPPAKKTSDKSLPSLDLSRLEDERRPIVIEPSNEEEDEEEEKEEEKEEVGDKEGGEKSEIDHGDNSKTENDGEKSTHVSSEERQGKESGGAFSNVIAMIQNLNDSKDNSERKSPPTETPAKCKEDKESEQQQAGSGGDTGMFVISSVVSQASDEEEEAGDDRKGPSQNNTRRRTRSTTQNLELNENKSPKASSKPREPKVSLDAEANQSKGDSKSPKKEETSCSDSEPTSKTTPPPTQSNKNIKGGKPDPNQPNATIETQNNANTIVQNNPVNSVYTCSFYRCSLWGTRDSSAFKIHNQLHHSEAASYACAFCMRTFATDEFLMKHINTSHTEARLFIHFRNYHCGFSDCSALFDREEELVAHIGADHAGSESFPCCFCQKEFSSEQELIGHIKGSITYTTTLKEGVKKATYKEILHYVYTVIEDRPEPVDTFIQLHLACVSKKEDGKKEVVNIRRCVDNYKAPAAKDEPEPVETFKCTNCSLITTDEDYFEEHVASCQKQKEAAPTLTKTEDPATEMVKEEMREFKEMNWEEEPSMDKPGPLPEAMDDDSESLPELEPPLLHPQISPPQKKGVLKSLGRGSPVACEKCTFSTEFRVVKAIHDRVHMYAQDKTKVLWCPHCPYSTDVVLHLKVHVQGHTEKSRIRLYTCSSCSYSSNQLDMVEDHHEDTHDGEELKSEVVRLQLDELQCFECSEVAKTEIELLEHLEREHNQDAVQSYLKDMYSIASLQIVDEENDDNNQDMSNNIPAAKHSRERPQPAASPSSSSIPTKSSPMSSSMAPARRGTMEPEEDMEQGSERFQCPHCSYNCYKCGSWVRHMQRHNMAADTEVIFYCCKTCKWKSTSKRKTIDHCKERHNEIILEVQTMTFSALKRSESGGSGGGGMHEEPHHEQSRSSGGISRYHCDFCDFSTNEHSVLNQHWKIHEGQTASDTLNDYEEVDDSYVDDYSNRKQTSTTDGASRYLTEGKDMNSETLKLIEDMFIQLAEDAKQPSNHPIICPICPYTTDLRKCMRRHLLFHKKQALINNGFKCSYCPYMSELEGVVTRHINKHHPDLPVKKIIVGNPKMQLAREIMSPSGGGGGGGGKSAQRPDGDKGQSVFTTPQSCPKCDYTTKLQYNLTQHMKTHDDNDLDAGMERVELDDTPGFTIAAVTGSDGSTDMVVREGSHVTRHSTTSRSSGEREGEDDIKSLFCTKVQDKDLYRCKICVFMDKDPGKIYRHFSNRHKDHCHFKCGYCDYQTITTAKVKQHCKIHHGGAPIKCIDTRLLNPRESSTPEYPTRTVTSDLIEDESTMEDDSREQTYDDWLATYVIKCGNNVQMCNACGYEQKGQAALKRHVLAVHLRYYPYKCKHCAFSAVEANKVLKHTDKHHPDLERRIIHRKIPDDLANRSTGGNQSPAVDSPSETTAETTSTTIGSVLNVKIKEEPRSRSPSPDPEDATGGQSDYENGSGYSTPERFDHVRIKQEPEDDYPDSPGATPTKLSRRQKYPKQYTKTYRCTECEYISRWNLADVKHHVLTVHLKIHSYSCPQCCFGSPKRGKLLDHYAEFHPDEEVNPDETREDIHSALSIEEQGDDVYIGLGEKSSAIAKRYPCNVKPRTSTKADSAPSGRQRSTSPGVPSPLETSTPEYNTRRRSGKTLGTVEQQPLDLSYRSTPPPSSPTMDESSLSPPARPSGSLRIPTITRPYSSDYEYPPITQMSIRSSARRRGKKKDYTLYKCSSCGRGYVQKIKAQYHFAMKHLNLHPYICNYCSYGEDARKRVIDHILKDHPDKEVVVFPAFREHALVQEKVYPVKVDLSEYEGAMRAVKYINDSGMLQQKEKAEKSVRCPQCSLLLPKQENLDDHMADSHQDYTGFKCCYCGVYVKAKQKMRYHLSAKHPSYTPKYQPIKQGTPYGPTLSTFDEIVRKKPGQFLGQNARPAITSNRLTVAFPFYKPKPQKIGFANISKKRLSARCSRGYRENTGNLVEDITLQMRVPTQPDPEEAIVEGRPPPKMIKPRSDVVGGTVWLLCNHCQYTTLTSTLMRHHVMSHINYRPFRCSYCSFNGVRSHQVKKHMISMHRKLPPIVKYRTDPDVESSLTDHFTMKVRRGSGGGDDEDISNDLLTPSSMMSPFSSSSSAAAAAVVNRRVNPHRSGSIVGGGDAHVPLKKIKLEKQTSEEERDGEDGEDSEEQLSSAADVGAEAGAGGRGEVGSRRPEFYLCVLCGNRRPSRSSLLRHIMWELDYRPWSCPHCDYRDVTLFGVKRHCFESHPKQTFRMVLKQNPERMSKIQALVEQSKANSGVSEKSVTAAAKRQDSSEGDERSSVDNTSMTYAYGSAAPTGGSVYEAGMMMAMPSDNTVVTSAEQLQAAEKELFEPQAGGDPHIYRCKHCTFQSPDKTCFKKHILRHGPKRFQCGYCSYCAVFKAELHRHMNRLHKRKAYKIISLVDNQVVTTKEKTKGCQIPIALPPGTPVNPVHKPGAVRSLALSVDAKAEGGMLAQLEAEIENMKSDECDGSDKEPSEPNIDTKTTPSIKVKEEGGGGASQEAFAVLDGVVLTEEHLALNAQGEYQCQFCDLSSPHRERARTHLAKHLQPRWKCGHCDMTHQLSYEMRRHIRHRHPGSSIKMLRLETEADFVPKPAGTPKSENRKEQVSVTPTKSVTPYTKPGPACSKRQRPNTAGLIPSVFCCFLCTFKTNNTVELVEHQKMHADAEKMPKLTPEEPIHTVTNNSDSAQLPSLSSLDELEMSESASVYVRPFKCRYCDFSGFNKNKVKTHCLQRHRDQAVTIVEQRHTRKDAVYAHRVMPELASKNLHVIADDILNIPQAKLEHLLKVNYLKGIRF